MPPAVRWMRPCRAQPRTMALRAACWTAQPRCQDPVEWMPQRRLWARRPSPAAAWNAPRWPATATATAAQEARVKRRSSRAPPAARGVRPALMAASRRDLISNATARCGSGPARAVHLRPPTPLTAGGAPPRKLATASGVTAAATAPRPEPAPNHRSAARPSAPRQAGACCGHSPCRPARAAAASVQRWTKPPHVCTPAHRTSTAAAGGASSHRRPANSTESTAAAAAAARRPPRRRRWHRCDCRGRPFPAAASPAVDGVCGVCAHPAAAGARDSFSSTRARQGPLHCPRVGGPYSGDGGVVRGHRSGR
jgi:hypothetical protein